jgi:DNA-binding PadR family transcriptional regulator
MWAHGWGSRHRRGLRVWVLQCLEQGPASGAELIAQIDRLTMGWWRPSPGSVYPLLEELEEEKLLKRNADGRYELTESARRGPDWMHGSLRGAGPRNPGDAVREIESYVRYLEDIAQNDRDAVLAVDQRLKDVSARLQALGRAGGPGRSG